MSADAVVEELARLGKEPYMQSRPHANLYPEYSRNRVMRISGKVEAATTHRIQFETKYPQKVTVLAGPGGQTHIQAGDTATAECEFMHFNSDGSPEFWQATFWKSPIPTE
jgi:hypothetical protein